MLRKLRPGPNQASSPTRSIPIPAARACACCLLPNRLAPTRSRRPAAPAWWGSMSCCPPSKVRYLPRTAFRLCPTRHRARVGHWRRLHLPQLPVASGPRVPGRRWRQPGRPRPRRTRGPPRHLQPPKRQLTFPEASLFHPRLPPHLDWRTRHRFHQKPELLKKQQQLRQYFRSRQQHLLRFQQQP